MPLRIKKGGDNSEDRQNRRVEHMIGKSRSSKREKGIQKRKMLTGGTMLKNPGKADLDKDGKLSGYEKKRGMAIEKSMSGKPMKAVGGALALGIGGDKLRKKFRKKMPLGLGAAALLAKKKKDILGAKRGKFAKTRRQTFGPDSEFDTYNKFRDMIDAKQKMQERKKQMEKDKQKISEKKKGIAVKSGGMMKYNKGGGADTGTKGEIKSRIGVATNKLKRVNRMLKRIGGRKAPKRPKLQAPERGPMKPLKAKEGKAVKNDPRTRDQRVKDAFPKKSPRARGVISTIGSQNPMKRDRLFEGTKARRRKMFSDALRKLGAAGKRLTPGGAGSEIARRIGQQISKKMSGGMMGEKTRKEIQKQKVKLGLGVFDEKGNFQAKKRKKMMGGGMMMKPMGYKSGTSVMARGCKLGRKKATKIM